MRVVADTNVLVQMAAAGERSPLFVAWQESRFSLVISEPLLVEFQGVLSRPKIQRFVPLARGRRFIELLVGRGILVLPALQCPPCRDPDDQTVIATAIGGRVKYLVTLDKDIYDDSGLIKALAELAVEVVVPAVFSQSLKL